MSVYAGAVAPARILFDITPSAALPDMTVVTAGYIRVTGPSGAVKNWTCTLSNQTTTTLRLTHVFAASGLDVTVPGKYKVQAFLSVPGGTRRTGFGSFTVV